MSENDISMNVAEDAAPERDAIIRANQLPALKGEGETHIRCGACNEVVFEGLTAAEVNQRIQTDQRLIVECTCGASNVVPRG